jgi:hypothetical protein
MTQEQREATILVNSFYDTNYHSNSIEVRWETAKKNALIATAIIYQLMIKFHGRHIEDNIHEIKYWEEVKQQIEKI